MAYLRRISAHAHCTRLERAKLSILRHRRIFVCDLYVPWSQLPAEGASQLCLDLLLDGDFRDVENRIAGDPAILGDHIHSGVGLTGEVIARHIEDRGGGLARVDGRTRLVEGLAFPNEELESQLRYYNSATYWVNIDSLLGIFGLCREELADIGRIDNAVRTLSVRMPTYVTLKDVKKRWGKGQEDVFPVAQFEKLWGDMTALPEFDTRFVVVPRLRGQQLKEQAQLDGWLRDGSAAYIETLCEF